MIDLIGWTDVLAWALLHFVWQGAAIAAVVALALHALHNARPDDRYRVAGAGMVAMALAPVVTVGVLVSGGGPAGVMALPVEVAAHPASWTVALVAAWTLGVVIGLGRNGVELVAIEVLRRRSIRAPPALQARFSALARRVGVRRVSLRLTPVGLSPLAIGWLRPAVLLPASLLVKLPADQIEALILHELAHVRRHDWIVNVAQAGVETLLFYHPAVHYLSRRMRHERELCCDAVAASTLCDPIVYARALTELHAAAQTPTLALAAKGGVLMERILRLIGRPSPARRPAWVWPTLAVSTAAALLAGAAAVASDPSDADPFDPLDGVASAVADDRDDDDDDDDLTEPEDVGAKALELLASQLEKGATELKDSAARLEAKGDERQARRAERRAERNGGAPTDGADTWFAPLEVSIRTQYVERGSGHKIAELQAELHRLQAELDRELADKERDLHVGFRYADDAYGTHGEECKTVSAGPAHVVVCGEETSVRVEGAHAGSQVDWEGTVALAMADGLDEHTEREVERALWAAERAVERAQRRRGYDEPMIREAQAEARREAAEVRRDAAEAAWDDDRQRSRRFRDPALIVELEAQAPEVHPIHDASGRMFDAESLAEQIERAAEMGYDERGFEARIEAAVEQYEAQAEHWAEQWEDWAEDFEENFEAGHWGEVEWPEPPAPPADAVAPVAPAPPAPPARVRAKTPGAR